MEPDDESYIPRDADRVLHEHLAAGKFCYVLNPRQVGKSSLMIRVAQSLKEAKVHVAIVDLQPISRSLSDEKWYYAVLKQIGSSLGLESELRDYWLQGQQVSDQTKSDAALLSPLDRWIKALKEVVLPKRPGRIVIFVDEIDSVRSYTNFSADEFFAAIRFLYNEQRLNSELKRLGFCLIGVATPSDLIRDTRVTPFNVGERLELRDFKDLEAQRLAAHLGRDKETNAKLLQRILYWTGGHPYLTQRFCSAVATNSSVVDAKGVDSLCQELFLSPEARGRDNNILFVRDRMLLKEASEREPRPESELVGLLSLYSRIHKGKSVADDGANPLISILHLSGIVRTSDGLLKPRNRIYQHVFDKTWIEGSMPRAELIKQRRQYRRNLIRLSAAAVVTIAFLSASTGFAFWQKRKADEAILEKGLTKENLDKLAQRLQEREETLRKAEERNRTQEDAINRANQALHTQETKIKDKTRIAHEKSMEAEKQKAEAAHQQEIAQKEKETAQKQKEIADNKTREAEHSEQKAKDQQVLAQKMEKRAEEKNKEADRLLYGANIKSAYSFYQIYSMSDFQTIFDKINPDYRDIEWDYLSQLTAGDVKLYELPKEGVENVVFTPDGRHLLTQYSDSFLKWDLNTGLSEPIFSDGKLSPGGRFVLSPDRKWLANLGGDSNSNPRLMLWNISSSMLGQERIEISLKPDDLKSVDKLSDLLIAFTTDGKEVILISVGKKVIHTQNWNLKSKEKSELSYTKTFENNIFVKAVSPVGQILAYAYLNNNPIDEILLDSKLNKIQKPEYIFNDLIGMVYFSDDGKKICFKDIEGLYIFDTVNNAVTKLPDDLTDPRELGLFFYNVTFSPDNELIAVVYREGIRVINLKKNVIVREFRIDNYLKSPKLSFSPNSELLAVGYPRSLNDVQNIIVLNISEGAKTLAFKEPGQVLACEDCYIDLNKDKTRLITIDQKGKLILWNYLTEGKLSTIANPSLNAGEKRRGGFVSNGLYFFSAIEYADKLNKNRFKNLQVWDAGTGNGVNLQALSERGIVNFRLNKDENKLAVLFEDKVGLWNLRNGSKMWEDEVEGSRNFLYVDEKVVGVFNSVNKQSHYYEIESGVKIDGNQLKSERVGSEDVYEKQTFKPVHSPNGNWTVYGDKNGYFLKNEKDKSYKHIQLQKAIEENFLPDVIFSNDSRLLAFLGYAGNDYVKNLETSEDVPISGTFLGDIKFSPSNTWLFSEHGRAIIYANTKTGKVAEIARCGNFGAPLLIFNEERVITGCPDGRIQFIDIKLGQEVLSIKTHDSEIIALKLSPDAKHLLTVSNKDGAKWWRLKF